MRFTSIWPNKDRFVNLIVSTERSNKNFSSLSPYKIAQLAQNMHSFRHRATIVNIMGSKKTFISVVTVCRSGYPIRRGYHTTRRDGAPVIRFNANRSYLQNTGEAQSKHRHSFFWHAPPLYVSGISDSVSGDPKNTYRNGNPPTLSLLYIFQLMCIESHIYFKLTCMWNSWHYFLVNCGLYG